MDVTRAQVLAFRVAAQGLHRTASSVDELAVLDIGVQEAMGHPAALAFTARVAGFEPVATGPGADLALAWTIRGAPHVHRRAQLDDLAAALWPLSEADAAARLNETAPSVERAGIPALDQFAVAVRELRAVVTKPTPKGEASRAVTERLPASMRRDCRTCQAMHLSDQAMRIAAPAAGLEIEPGSAPPVLVRRKGGRTPKRVNAAALSELARGYLRVLGPATVTDFAGYLGARRADVAEHWPDDLAEVAVDGKRAWLPAECVDALAASPDPDVVRLLGPYDPYLQARDRAVIVPDKATQKALWPAIGRPGVLLAGGEVVGTWRTRTSGNKLTLTVEPLVRVPKTVWAHLDAEAELVAAARGASGVTVKRGA